MNKVKEVCELLGVEAGEEFQVKDYGNNPYMINYVGCVLVKIDCEWTRSESISLEDLVCGDAEIIKQWKPVLGEEYYIVDFSRFKSYHNKYEFVYNSVYVNDKKQNFLIELKKANLAFDNPEDAQKRAYEIIGRD